MLFGAGRKQATSSPQASLAEVGPSSEAAREEAEAVRRGAERERELLASGIDGLGDAVAALGDLRAQSAPAPVAHPIFEQVTQRLTEFRERLRNTLIGLDKVVMHSATGVAKSSMEMNALATHINETHDATEKLVESTKEVQLGAEQVAKAATESAELAAQVEHVTHEGKIITGEAVEAIQTLQGRMQDMAQHLGALVEQVQAITQVTDVISGIASQTNLLALNAAIEAARAGEAGRGFAVVANEVRRLAESAALRTKDIGTLVNKVTSDLAPTRHLINESLELVLVGTNKVEAAGESLNRIDGYVKRTAVNMQEIAAAVEEQSAATEMVISGLHEVARHVQSVRAETMQVSESTFRLSEATEKAYEFLAPFKTDTVFQDALNRSRELGDRARAIFEQAIDSGKLSLGAVTDPKYEVIKGASIQRLKRFFDISRVPATGFDPAKYSTGYDALVDEELQQVYDEIMDKDKRLIFALILDLNAYVPAHNKVFCRDWTGDRAKDLAGNRVKRFFGDNAVLLRGSRMGLNAKGKLPEIATRQNFVQAGCNLRESEVRSDDFLVQTYARDTGEVTAALSVPFYVKGERCGSVFIGWLENANG